MKKILYSLSRSLISGKKPADPDAFRAMFERFRKVLDSNNRAMETITDLGEKLGGDYLFDIVYLRKSYAQLKKDMENSLADFDRLTGNSYPQLHEALTRIDLPVEQALSDNKAASAQPVLFFEEMPWESVHEAGGKMVQLAELRKRTEIRIPDGFAVTVAGFDEFVRHNALQSLIDGIQKEIPGLSEKLRELQERIDQGVLPPKLALAIGKALDRIQKRNRGSLLAVRSSAQEEDGSRSFAGQFSSVLGVPADIRAFERAYKRVIASLYGEKPVSYLQQTGDPVGHMKMAVGCMVMVDAVSSGVVYSTAPEGDPDTMIISAAWGLGETVVEGRTGADIYVVRKDKTHEVLKAEIAVKNSMIVTDEKAGTNEKAVPDEIRQKACLSPDQIKMLAGQTLKIERHFGSPRDIEWAIDKNGTIFILQARPLKRVSNEHSEGLVSGLEETIAGEPRPAILKNQGTVVQRGAGAGTVFIAKNPHDMELMPKGAVLVAAHDSSLFVKSMPYLSAIITETGSQTSHMAALCRELKIPTIVNMSGAMTALKQGQKVTVIAAEDNRSTVLGGIAHDLLAKAGQERDQMESVYEFRRRRYILRYISPLHLVDPMLDEFSPERCRSMHDILRFIHEKSISELVDSARSANSKLKRRGAVVELDLPVPAGILVMDIGGGLESRPPGGKASLRQILSTPFRSIVKGMIHPGAWHFEPVALTARDFLSSMMRMTDVIDAAEGIAGYNIAVISRDYVNMSIRFGYHFNMIDCYCSEKAKNNHIYFRFTGGATDMTKRTRRLDLIARVLNEFGFAVKIKGDMLIARVSGLGKERIEHLLNQTGRLIAYARQLDALLHDDRAVELYGRRFMEGNYELPR